MRRRQLIVLGALLAVLGAASRDDPASTDAERPRSPHLVSSDADAARAAALAQWRGDRRSLQMWSGMGMYGAPQIPRGYMGHQTPMMGAGAMTGPAVGPSTLDVPAGAPIDPLTGQPAGGAAYSQRMAGGPLPGLAPAPGQMAQPLDPMLNPVPMATYSGPGGADPAAGMRGPGSAPRERVPGSTSGGATGTDAWSAMRVYNRHDCMETLKTPGVPIIGCRFASEVMKARSRRYLGE